MISSIGNSIVIAIATIVIIICSISIIIASKFQKIKSKKYKEVQNIIKQKEGQIFKIRDGLTKEEIKTIDNNVDVDKLLKQLYDTYLNLENKVKNLDDDLDNVLIGTLKEFYITKIKSFKERNLLDITEGIELINYSIIEYNKDKLKFRVNINCFSYKTVNNEIISGSNLERVQRIILLTYEKVNKKWFISSYDKLYERKLSE